VITNKTIKTKLLINMLISLKYKKKHCLVRNQEGKENHLAYQMVWTQVELEHMDWSLWIEDLVIVNQVKQQLKAITSVIITTTTIH